MMLETTRLAGQNNLVVPTKAYESSTFSADVSFFNSAMDPSAPTYMATQQTVSPNIVSEASGRANALTKNITKSLRAMTDKSRYDEARKYPGQLSNALLLTSLLSKSLGKTAQCVDKLCNLQ